MGLFVVSVGVCWCGLCVVGGVVGWCLVYGIGSYSATRGYKGAYRRFWVFRVLGIG